MILSFPSEVLFRNKNNMGSKNGDPDQKWKAQKKKAKKKSAACIIYFIVYIPLMSYKNQEIFDRKGFEWFFDGLSFDH